MSTLVVGTPPPELQALLDRRSRAGADRLDEVWEGVGESRHDFRVPDGGLHRRQPKGTWQATAALVVEIASPGDESWQKLLFYARHDVDEVLIVDLGERTIAWLALREGEYGPVSQSALIELGPTELAGKLDWP